MQWLVHNRLSIPFFWPELVLIGGSLAVILIGAFVSNSRKLAAGMGLITLGVYASLSIRLLNVQPIPFLFSGAIAGDSFAVFFKLLFAFVTAVTIFFVLRSEELRDYGMPEIVAFLLALTLGLSMMAASTDILMMYLSLETVSVLSYILVGYKRHSRMSSEAGLKYILYGAFASGIMIFGLSYIFGIAGSTQLSEIAQYFGTLQGGEMAPVILFALFATMIGFGFKMAIFPTQMWCPDVYEGAAIPVTAFLSVAPKAAGFAMALRFFFTGFGIEAGQGVAIFEFINWGLVLAVLSAITMTIGNLAALPQRNLKRLLAYSSIAHAGYLLMGFSALNAIGVQAILVYLIAYALMNLGAFVVVLIVGNLLGTEEIDGYRGLGWRAPLLAIPFVVFLFSLTGIPPVLGFVGKALLFYAVIQEGLYWLAVIAAINTAISLFYYARILRAMYFDKAVDSAPVPVPGWSAALPVALAIPTIVLFFYWQPLFDFAVRSIDGVF